MANGKRSLFSSLFGRGKSQDQKAEQIADLEAKQKLEERIQQVLAVAETPKLFAEENQDALQDGKAEIECEILPITASAFRGRQVPAPKPYLPSSVEVDHRYVANDRW